MRNEFSVSRRHSLPLQSATNVMSNVAVNCVCVCVCVCVCMRVRACVREGEGERFVHSGKSASSNIAVVPIWKLTT